MKVQERFLKYISFDTQSDEASKTTPSTLKQLLLANYLAEEMKHIGMHNVAVDEYGIVYGTIPATAGCEGIANIGFIAHMDTSPDMSGNNVCPRIIENYDGKDIELNPAVHMNPAMFSKLGDMVGKDLIVTDGTTLLGADDKAGIAEIMTMAEVLIQDQKPHGTIQIAFTPDEEVGHGADHFDVKKFHADFAYTVDGGPVDSIDYENFNAASAVVSVQGSSIHPGDAKQKMLNASIIAMEFHSMLPVFLNPAFTEGYEGFNHLTDMKGECEHAQLSYIIRNHDKTLFEKQKDEFHNIAAYMNKKYPSSTIQLEIEDSYANMRNVIEEHMDIIRIVESAMKTLGIDATSHAIRGGTDGARLTYDGLPCPNLGTGGYNYHGKYEYACIQEMNQSVDLLLAIVANVLNENITTKLDKGEN